MDAPLQHRVCLVEDDPIMGESLRDRLELEGYRVDWRETAQGAIDLIISGHYHVIITDVRLPDLSGELMYETLVARCPIVPPTVFITAYGEIDRAVALLKLGAADYITKPFDIDEFIAKIGFVCTRAHETESGGDAPVLGVSLAMRELETRLARVAQFSSNVLITGESGTGKEMIARCLHQRTCRDPDAPFVAVNCGAVPETLIEAELFGYEKGAFTGASRTRKGVFEQAVGGTLFLDEIGEMPLTMQVKLLRVIEDHALVRVGGEDPVPIEVHLICATNCDLIEDVQCGRFREDLFYRINVIHFDIPPLRERRKDILWLAEKFLTDHTRRYPQNAKSVDEPGRQALVRHPWPGNIRELKHCIERACVLTDRPVITASDLFAAQTETPATKGARSDVELRAFLASCERRYILDVLSANDWHISRTAQHLNISRKNLWERMKRLDIEREHASRAPGSS